MKWIVLFICLLTECVYAQNRYDVVIDEIMADPSPQVGLPNYEWIEVKNMSSAPIDMAGWRIADASSQSGPMPPFILQPDSFLLICSSSGLSSFLLYGPAISVTGFPSLDNSGDLIYLINPAAEVIHAVHYLSSWHQNSIKAGGGWSLEMIDPASPCAGSKNWSSSTDPAGGTPGRKNAIDGFYEDDDPPVAKNAYLLNDSSILLVFDEPIDSGTAADPAHFLIDGLPVRSVNLLPPFFNTIRLGVTPFSPGTIYSIIIHELKDCKGNIISNRNTVRVGLPSEPLPQDLVINEILFNPRSGGSDYVELYNRSNKIIDAGQLFIANRGAGGLIGSQEAVSPVAFYLFPNDYIVLTEDVLRLSLDYFVKKPDDVLEVDKLPSFPDNEGTALVLNKAGDIIDEVHYFDDWHFSLISNDEGISLERIDPGGTSQDPMNWHSAASTAGYGTPGYQNSQFRMARESQSILTVSPKIFSPDNDGRDDLARILFKVNEPGFVANVSIFDIGGRLIRKLVQNQSLGTEGSWTWDGLDDNKGRLPVGIYIVFTQLFNLKGETRQFRNVLVLARKMK